MFQGITQCGVIVRSINIFRKTRGRPREGLSSEERKEGLWRQAYPDSLLAGSGQDNPKQTPNCSPLGSDSRIPTSGKSECNAGGFQKLEVRWKYQSMEGPLSKETLEMQTARFFVETAASPGLLDTQQMKRNAVPSPLPVRTCPFSGDPYPGEASQAAQGILAASLAGPAG